MPATVHATVLVPQIKSASVCACGVPAETSLPTGATGLKEPKFKPVCRKCAAKARLASLLDLLDDAE